MFKLCLVLWTLYFIGTFKWEWAHDEAEYTNWWPGEPNNDRDNGDCVMKSLQSYESYPVNDRIGWDDYPCDNETIQEFSIYALCMNF